MESIDRWQLTSYGFIFNAGAMQSTDRALW